MTYVLGVDLGTATATAAVNRDGKVSVCRTAKHNLVVPSVVHLGKDGTVRVGRAAEAEAKTDPIGAAREFKRHFGDAEPILLNGTPVAPPDLMLALATHVVNQASALQQAGPDQIVVSYPGLWDDRKTALLAATLAGSSLPPHRLISEQVAVAIHSTKQQPVEPGKVIAVYDLGAGAFNIVLLRKLANGWETVGAPGGIEQLGGNDFDAAILQHAVDSLEIDLTSFDDTDPAFLVALRGLRAACNDAKHQLSTETEVTIPVELPGVSQRIQLTRTEFELLITPDIRRTMSTFADTLSAASIQLGDIDRILLVGGSGSIPLIHQQLRSRTGLPVVTERHPTYAVALGAAASASPEAETVEVKAAVVPPADNLPRAREMYQLPHISEAPLPEFMQKRKPLVVPPTPEPAQRPSSPPPQHQPTVVKAPAAPAQAPPANRTPPTVPQQDDRRPNRSGLWIAIGLLLAVVAVAAFLLLRQGSTDDESAPPTSTTPTSSTASTAATSAAPTTATSAAATTVPPTEPAETPTTLGAACSTAQEPELDVSYRVSEIPDDEVAQTLNGRNVPSLTSVNGVVSVPVTTFPEFSELDLTYDDCVVDSRGRVWWGVNFEDQVVWASTFFIEPTP